VAQAFINAGYPKVYALKAGWNEWFENNFPVEKKPAQ
jgi:rhodanese-related sulfurtransferase